MTNEQIDEMLAKIIRAPLLTCEEERTLIKGVKEKGTDCDEMKRLEEANMRFLVCLIGQYRHRGLSLKELIEAGKEGLRDAVVNHVSESDNRFITDAVKCMRQSIEKAIEERNL